MALYARNETSRPITANGIGAKRFELSAKGNSGFSKLLPVSVARLDGFQRIWATGAVTVSQNADFSSPLTAGNIPEGEITSDVVKPATTGTAGLVKKAAAVPESTATTVAGAVADHNALVAALKSAGIVS